MRRTKYKLPLTGATLLAAGAALGDFIGLSKHRVSIGYAGLKQAFPAATD